ncbi:MepB family protein [Zhihengliuella halotolerans]|uniref:Metallopeptidase n=1 Tax=Zhihengliuella halotolerans TaxID=370736 RepID=A0A4Q8AG90_9MICC|nr:MepB family protein [Zhihengliuella halotolerans]RZU62765.1 hypothetical protein EV380_2367 [Zhihengliuella halotolerans]
MNFPSFDWFSQHCLEPRGQQFAVLPEEQNSDYESGIVDINGEHWRIRTARITPTKAGAFVAVWRRNADGETEPFPADEAVSGLMVFVVDGHRRGCFRFTSERLAELGITRGNRSPGKRGFRLYPSWCEDLNPTAARAQAAQASSFSVLNANGAA